MTKKEEKSKRKIEMKIKKMRLSQQIKLLEEREKQLNESIIKKQDQLRYLNKLYLEKEKTLMNNYL